MLRRSYNNLLWGSLHGALRASLAKTNQMANSCLLMSLQRKNMWYVFWLFSLCSNGCCIFICAFIYSCSHKIIWSLQGIIPLIKWERATLTPLVLACILFTTVALFPSIILPSTPSMWVAGMTFGYGYGFLLIMSAVAIGVSLPYLIGSLIHHKIQVSTLCCCGRFLHIVHKRLVPEFLYLILSRTWIGLVRKIPKECISDKISRWGRLVWSISSCGIDKNISFPLHHIQLLCCCNQCKIWTLYLRVHIGNGTRCFGGHLHVSLSWPCLWMLLYLGCMLRFCFQW